MENKIIIDQEYNKLGEGVLKTIKEMKELSTNELRLWIIQELSCPDSECWWLIDVGIDILKNKMGELSKGENEMKTNTLKGMKDVRRK